MTPTDCSLLVLPLTNADLLAWVTSVPTNMNSSEAHSEKTFRNINGHDAAANLTQMWHPSAQFRYVLSHATEGCIADPTGGS